jgi:hypothetical protein
MLAALGAGMAGAQDGAQDGVRDGAQDGAQVGAPAGAQGETQAGAITEAAVKAAFLYHFGTYVDWPDPPIPDTALSIAVLYDAEVFEQLDRYLPGRTIEGRPVVPRLIASLDELDDDAVLFIGRTANRDLDGLLASPATQGKLVVTDSPGGIRTGATINFTVVDNRVRFEIDRSAASRSGLSLSSRLLAAALRVTGEP